MVARRDSQCTRGGLGPSAQLCRQVWEPGAAWQLGEGEAAVTGFEFKCCRPAPCDLGSAPQSQQGRERRGEHSKAFGARQEIGEEGPQGDSAEPESCLGKVLEA